MKIEYQKGDVLKGTEFIVVHGCNAMGVMGRGFAKHIHDQLAFAFIAYRQTFEENGLELGSIVWGIDIRGSIHDRIIGNMITQAHWHKDFALDGRNVDYDAVRACIRKVAQFVAMIKDETIKIDSLFGQHDFDRVGMPLVGCGLGGGDWKIISEIIEEESKDVFRPVVYVLE